MKYFSAFSGIGGFELGIQYAFNNQFGERLLQDHSEYPGERPGSVPYLASQPSCVGYSEIDKYAIQVYEHRFPNHKNYGDITKIDTAELPEFDLLVGGFPCQTFSVAGKRAGFLDETRGTLFFELARILDAKKPSYFVFENVKGLLSHGQGSTFSTIIATLDELGYDLQWQVLNSKDFGVPQNRERIYLVGHLRGKPRPQIFPIFPEPGEDIKEITRGVPQAERVYDGSGVSPTLDTAQGGNRQPKIIASRGRYDENGKTVQMLEERPDDLSNTLTSVQKDNMVISKTIRVGGAKSPHGSKQNWDSYEIEGQIRRLTPKECERLQGFPDDWTAYGSMGKLVRGLHVVSDSQRYKMCGNAVTVNTVEAVFNEFYKSLM